MISFTSAEFNALLAAWFFPMARILALVAVSPVFSNAALPRRVRLAFGLALTLAIAPSVPPIPAIEPASGAGLLILAEQILIGVSMGMVMQMVFAAIGLAGELISMQMGLGFATMYDPMSTSQTVVTGEFIALLATLIFLGMDGHLTLIVTLADSFRAMPISTTLPSPGFLLNVIEWGRMVFAYGLLLAMPVLVTLIIVNIALAVLSRAAPQLNLMNIGFPITLIIGMLVLSESFSYLITPLRRMYEEGFVMMLGIFLGR